MGADDENLFELEIDPAADQRVLGALRTGDQRRAARLMITTYGNAVNRLCRAVASSPERADELAYASFASAFAALGDFRARGRPSVWMLDVARARCRELLALLASERAAEAEAAGAVPASEQSGFSAELAAAMARLPPAPSNPSYADGSPPPEVMRGWYSQRAGVTRAALGLFAFGDLAAPELAFEIGVSVEACRAWLMGVLGAASAHAQLGKVVDPTSATSPPGLPREVFPELIAALGAIEFPRSAALTRRLEVLAAAL